MVPTPVFEGFVSISHVSPVSSKTPVDHFALQWVHSRLRRRNPAADKLFDASQIGHVFISWMIDSDKDKENATKEVNR